MAARISAPRIWVRLRFTAVTVAQSGGERKLEKGKLKLGRLQIRGWLLQNRAGQSACVTGKLARVH